MKQAFPTMVTPYNHDGSVDFGAAEAMVEWYWKKGCDGIFAVCQSSEIFFLTLEERAELAKRVKRKADTLAAADKSRAPMTIVVSGHVSDKREDQVRELSAVAESGADAVILISNRMDIENTSDEAWIADAERLLDAMPDGLCYGVYECPAPYKRLLTPKMLDFCAKRGFRFIKDTCCNAATIAERVKQLEGSPTMLYNANAQTLLETLRAGAAGYCGVMANFHPELYVWLCHQYENHPELADTVQSILCMAAFTESLAYPCTAKYHLSEIVGIPMSLHARSRDVNQLTDYQKDCVRQMDHLAQQLYQKLTTIA